MQGQIVRQDERKLTVLGEDRWFFWLTGQKTGGKFDLLEGEVGYGEGPPLHMHHEQDDTILVVEGTLTMQVGDEILELEPGDVGFAPKGVPHTFTNKNRDRKTKIINIMTPGGFDQVLDDFSQNMPADITPEKLEELEQKHKLKMLGPPLAVILELV